MNKAYFITGTGTDVGKTYIARGLSMQFCVQNTMPFKYIKPFASGALEESSDVMKVRETLSGFKHAISEGWHHFREPASPYIASLADSISINYEEVILRLRKEISNVQNLLVEGAGGLYVPITQDKMMIDFIVDLQLPIIVVSHLGLGTVNHTSLTIDALKHRGCKVVGYVLNQIMKKEALDLAERTNQAEITRINKTPCLGVVPYLCDFDTPVFEKIAMGLLQK